MEAQENLEKKVFFPVLVRGGDVGYEFAVGTRTYGKIPVLEYTGVVETENGRCNEEIERTEENISRGHMTERVGMKLSHGDSVISSHVLVERRKRKAL